MVYLLHFSKSFRHARHFIGFAPASIAELGATLTPEQVPSAPILNAAKDAGVEFTVARVWEGDALRARQLRRNSNAVGYCSICADVRAALAPGAPAGVVSPRTDNATTGTGQRASLTGVRAKVCYRTLGKHGNSLMLCVPGVFAYALKVFRGAAFRLELHDDEQGFTARVVERGRISPSLPGNIHGVAEVTR